MQGFASGDAELDAWAIRRFVADGHCIALAQSFAKNFGLYGQRIGALSVVCNDAEEVTYRLRSDRWLCFLCHLVVIHAFHVKKVPRLECYKFSHVSPRTPLRVPEPFASNCLHTHHVKVEIDPHEGALASTAKGFEIAAAWPLIVLALMNRDVMALS